MRIVMEVWAGVDVGGRRKGFHLALLSEAGVVLGRAADPRAAFELLDTWQPVVIGVDSPAAWAPPGMRSRPEERAFAKRRICGIRYTPDAATAAAHPGTYYEWIYHGLELWQLLAGVGLVAVEVFPTASFTAWGGPRPRDVSRADWTTEVLHRLGVDEVAGAAGARSQDHRDALAGALTARQYHRRPHECHIDGVLVVPVPGSVPLP
jgi:predicted nuclease with RNAse H fold